MGGLGTLHTAAPPPHFPILAFHCWIGFQLNNTYVIHDCVNITQQWSKNTDKYVLDYSEVLHLRQPICAQKNETPKKTQLRPPRTPPRLRHNHQPTITQNPTNQPPPRHRTPTHPHRRSRAPHARHSCEGRNPEVRGEGPSPSLIPNPHRTTHPPPPSYRRKPVSRGAWRGASPPNASPHPITRAPPKSVRPEPVEACPEGTRRGPPAMTRAPSPHAAPRATLPPCHTHATSLNNPSPHGPHG